jgi:pimeloyl-ACP methyl ester carboxylesterase
MYIDDQGEGEAVVLIHGANPVSYFDDLVEALRDEYRVLVPHIPGWGRSLGSVKKVPILCHNPGVMGGPQVWFLTMSCSKTLKAARRVPQTPQSVGKSCSNKVAEVSVIYCRHHWTS